jgi:hypothetical protein
MHCYQSTPFKHYFFSSYPIPKNMIYQRHNSFTGSQHLPYHNVLKIMYPLIDSNGRLTTTLSEKSKGYNFNLKGKATQKQKFAY